MIPVRTMPVRTMPAGIADIDALLDESPSPGFDFIFDLAVDPDCTGGHPCNVVNNGVYFEFARARLSQLAARWAAAERLDATQNAALQAWLDNLPWHNDRILLVWGLDADGDGDADGQLVTDGG